MGKHGKTVFQDNWMLDSEIGSWIKKVPGDNYSATCKLCIGSIISVCTMGRQALISHGKSKKHQLKLKGQFNQPSVSTFIHKQNLSSDVGNSSIENPLLSYNTESMQYSQGLTDTIIKAPSTLETGKKSTIKDKFVLSSQISRAEVIWCLHSVHAHKSNRAAAKDINVFKYIFPENETLQKMSLERTKIGYVVTFGLAPHFKIHLTDQVKMSENFVISFDESLNKISQSQQMDLVVRFWDTSKNEVSTRYLTSAFLKRTTAADLLTAFLAAVDCLDLNNLIQISMDGPNVNKKFLSDLNEYLSVDLKLETKMIDLGSCGLHTLHCAFKAAITLTNWNLIQYLRATYNFFKDHPARRGRFTQLTGSSIFPKKFCAIRWLENEGVAQNAMDMLPSMKKYVENLEKDKSNPDTKSFNIIKESLRDPLLSAKLGFFKTLSCDVQPVLEEYQSNSPLAPFLYTSLRTLILKEMERFVVSEKVSVSLKVLKNNENFVPLKKVDVGIAAKCEIGKSKDNVTMLQVNSFKNECKIALKCFVERLLEKSPLQYEATKYLTSLDPAISHTKIGQERFEKLVILMTKNNLISSQLAEKAQKEFKTVCSSSEEKMKKFKRVERTDAGQKKTNKLDHFWIDLLKENSLEKSALETLVKKILILSHGNAQVERGFSINKECLIENMKEESLVAIRTVYDAVEYYGGVENVPIDKKTIQSARNAYGKYKDSLENQRKKNREESESNARKRRNQLLLKELEEKKQKLMSEARQEAENIDKKISNLINL